MPDVYYYRALGKKYCKTDGSEHYKGGDVEPLDLIIASGMAEGFMLASIIKYAHRFPTKQHLDDLKKIADYAHILCGVVLAQWDTETKPPTDEEIARKWREDAACSTSGTTTE